MTGLHSGIRMPLIASAALFLASGASTAKAQNPGPLSPISARPAVASPVSPAAGAAGTEVAQPGFETIQAAGYPDNVLIRTSPEPGSPLAAQIHATLVPHTSLQQGLIRIDIQLAPGCHVYSLTQPDPRQTRIDVAQGPALKISGPAQPSHRAERTEDDAGPAESYSNLVTFFVPLQILDSRLLESSAPLVRVNGMICSDEGFCLPIRDQVLAARLANAEDLELPDSATAELAPPSAAEIRR